MPQTVGMPRNTPMMNAKNPSPETAPSSLTTPVATSAKNSTKTITRKTPRNASHLICCRSSWAARRYRWIKEITDSSAPMTTRKPAAVVTASTASFQERGSPIGFATGYRVRRNRP